MTKRHLLTLLAAGAGSIAASIAPAQAAPIHLPPLPPLSPAHAAAANPSTPIVVLGARLNDNCTPPAVLNSRLDTAANFSRIHPFNPIIVTGGHTQKSCPSEAQAMELGLRARLLPNPIIRDDRAMSTIENAANTARLKPGNKDMVIVTSGDHCGRATRDFAAQGVHATCVAAPMQ